LIVKNYIKMFLNLIIVKELLVLLKLKKVHYLRELVIQLIKVIQVSVWL